MKFCNLDCQESKQREQRERETMQHCQLEERQKACMVPFCESASKNGRHPLIFFQVLTRFLAGLLMLSFKYQTLRLFQQLS